MEDCVRESRRELPGLVPLSPVFFPGLPLPGPSSSVLFNPVFSPVLFDPVFLPPGLPPRSSARSSLPPRERVRPDDRGKKKGREGEKIYIGRGRFTRTRTFSVFLLSHYLNHFLPPSLPSLPRSLQSRFLSPSLPPSLPL